jgi:CBS domain-containing protein
MDAGDICNRDVVTIGRTETILDAARRMRSDHVGTLIVVNDEAATPRPIGILTDRDIVIGVIAEDPEELSRFLVGDVMSFDVTTAYEDEDVDDVLARMRREGIRRVPVIDDDETLVGIIALDDVLEALSRQLDEVTRLVAREIQIEREVRG